MAVFNFSPWNRSDLQAHPEMRHRFHMSETKLARSAQAVRAAFAAVRRLARPPARVALRSTPEVDDDLCLLATAPHVLTTGGGFGELVNELRGRVRRLSEQTVTS